MLPFTAHLSAGNFENNRLRHLPSPFLPEPLRGTVNNDAEQPLGRLWYAPLLHSLKSSNIYIQR